MSNFTHYRAHVGVRSDKHFKATIFQGDSLMIGINCLEPGQMQPVHQHTDQDKAYVVMEGAGRFTVGDAVRDAGEGEIIWAPAGVAHGVENTGNARLILLVNMAPPPDK